jgi:nucleotide-binding universal stress UspA family protein
MNGFRKLLVPLDGSRLAEAVLPVTMLLAKAFGATVALLHVMEQDAPETVHGERHLANVQEAEAYLAKVAGDCDCEGISVELHVHPNLERDVVASVIGHAGEFGADLVILATHGWGGVRDIMVGSIAQQVLRRGTKPVLLVKPAPHVSAPFEVRRVLVPLDGSRSHDDVVLPVAGELAQALKAEVRLLVVVPTLSTVSGDKAAAATLMPSATSAALDLEQEDAAGYLEGVANRLRTGGIAATAEVRRGEAAAGVVGAAGSTGAGLIVMSTHARAGLDALWSASVGAKILSRIQQPLLLVRVQE